nr:PREDICTED: uncharacterized protein LOC105668096 [Linepithema humile]
MACKYSIIHFLDEEAVEIVPVSWIKKELTERPNAFGHRLTSRQSLLCAQRVQMRSTLSMHAELCKHMIIMQQPGCICQKLNLIRIFNAKAQMNCWASAKENPKHSSIYHLKKRKKMKKKRKKRKRSHKSKK